MTPRPKSKKNGFHIELVIEIPRPLELIALLIAAFEHLSRIWH